MGSDLSHYFCDLSFNYVGNKLSPVCSRFCACAKIGKNFMTPFSFMVSMVTRGRGFKNWKNREKTWSKDHRMTLVEDMRLDVMQYNFSGQKQHWLTVVAKREG